MLHGDFGKSLTNQRVIIEELAPRFLNTLFLAGYAAVIAVPLAVGLGILSAIREGRLTDRLANILTLIAISVPEFFVGYILIIIFAIQLGLVSRRWRRSISDMGVGERFYVAFLPALTLTMVVMAHMLRMTRNSVLSIMSTPYIEMAFLKGLTRSRVVAWHALPNALGRSSRWSRSISPISSSASSWSRTCSSIPASGNIWSTRSPSATCR